MNLYEVIAYCLDKQGNQIYCKELNLYVYSEYLPNTKVLCLFLSTPNYPTPLMINDQLLHATWIKD